ncbi:ParA family protein, partial [Pirellulales bacterium]|nr:ParA family protein [Pirellulales bacterium]
NLAAALAEMGYRVCAVDIDEQCNMSTGLGIDINSHKREGKHTSLDIYLNKRAASKIAVPLFDAEKNPRFGGRISVIPGHRQLNSAKSQLDAEVYSSLLRENASQLDEDEIKDEQRGRFRASLDTLRGDFDVVFIDTPPDLGFLTTSALLAADWLIIPVFPSAYDLDGLEKIKDTRKKVARRYNPTLNVLGVLLGNVVKANLDLQIYNMLSDVFNEKVFTTKISASVRQREAPLYGQSVLEHEPEHQSSDQFRSLASEVVKRLERADLLPTVDSETTVSSASIRREVNQPV